MMPFVFAKCVLTKKARGFSLIELMISILIGLIILNGVIQIVVNSKRSFLDNQEVSQIQENARFAIDILSRELRMAGYFGCAPGSAGIFNIAPIVGASPMLVPTTTSGQPALLGINGYDGGDPAPGVFIGTDRFGQTDALIVRRTNPLSEGILGEGAVDSVVSTVKVAGGSDTLSNIKAGQPLILISPDCTRGLAFRATADATTAGTEKIITGLPKPGDASEALLGYFQAGSTLAELVSDAYYIGTSNVVENMPALMRKVLWVESGTLKTRSEELALGIADMQLAYGTLDSSKTMTYAKTSTDIANLKWDEVVVVQINLLMQSLKPVHDKPEPVTFLGASLPASRYLRQVVSATVRIRNQ
ncbi:PilW family protein [Marinagarivorans algicola]|uniref:PilW family protein n=1 Tax=Marinagarivorans algicola TaxID=1513270 RepID=UPI0006B5EDAA|nr:PilW family protein [Marinagarivorans algicola]